MKKMRKDTMDVLIFNWSNIYNPEELMQKNYEKKKVKDIINQFEMKDEKIKCKVKWYIPEYQRDRIWSKKKQSNYIQFMLKDASGGQMGAEFRLGHTKGKESIQVIDGQQRLTAIKEFVNDNYKSNNKFFSQLDPKEQNKILNYQLEFFNYKDITELDAIEIYQAVNSNQAMSKESMMKAKLKASKNEAFDFFLEASKDEENQKILPVETRKEKESKYYTIWAYTKVSDKFIPNLKLKNIESEITKINDVKNINNELKDILKIHNKLWIDEDDKIKISGKALIMSAMIKKKKISLNDKNVLIKVEKIKKDLMDLNSSGSSGNVFKAEIVNTINQGLKRYNLV